MFSAKIANHIFRIDNKYNYIKKLFSDYIIDDDGSGVLVSAQLCEIEAENTDNSNAYSPGYLESLAVYRKICEYLIDYNIILFHCSAVEVDGNAYLFTAPSGTGKSTHTRLWRKRFGSRLTVINDDKPLLEFKNDEILVYGTPYGGKHNLQTNTCARVSGIVYLCQSVNNEIRRLTPGEAYSLMFLQAYRSKNKKDSVLKTLEFVTRLCGLPVFRLDCNISDEAVDLAYSALIGE